MSYNGLNSSTSASSTVVTRDMNSNSAANNFASAQVLVVAAGGTTVLTAASARIQQLRGTLAQTFQLPDATTLALGWTFEFNNNSASNLSVVDATSGAVCTVLPGAYARVTASSVSTTAGTWDKHFLMPANAAYGTAGLAVTGTLASGSSATQFTVDASGNATGAKFKCSAFQMTTSPTNGYVLTSDASGNGSWAANGSGFSAAAITISPTAGQGDYTTITAGLAAAVSGQDILVKEGTYTENLTLKAGVNLVAWDANSFTPNVTIIGKCSFSAAGTAAICGINLQTNGDFCLSVTGSAASDVTLTRCFISATNHTAMQNTSSGGGEVDLYDCNGQLSTTGIAYFTMSGNGKFTLTECEFANNGGSTTASTGSSGAIEFYNCHFINAVTTSSTGSLLVVNSLMDAPIIVGGNAGTDRIVGTTITTGSSSAISVGSGSTLLLSSCSVSSSNTNAITGLGTLNYGGIVFTGSSSTINTSIQNPIPWPVKQGGTGVTTMTTAYAPVCAGTSATGPLQVASTGISNSGYVLTSNGSSALPSFQAIGVSSSGTWTPTIVGGTVAGTTTYISQQGNYVTIGSLVVCSCVLQISAATGTGDCNIGGLPFPAAQTASCASQWGGTASWVWPVGRTSVSLEVDASNSFLIAKVSGTGVTAANMQMANDTLTVAFTLVYLK